jgi:hypothetical protein
LATYTGNRTQIVKVMARWGRTTDVEYVYRAFSGRATIQAEGHKEVEFRQQRDGTHPLLMPVNDNNMIREARVSCGRLVRSMGRRAAIRRDAGAPQGRSALVQLTLGHTDFAIRTRTRGAAESASGFVRTTFELPPCTRPDQISEIGFECVVRKNRRPILSPQEIPASLFWTKRIHADE